ncbi:MAG TPA: hypothetical protein VF669_22415 [Tepidisphaeraceae bacterium]|jgi:hypothetical protein
MSAAACLVFYGLRFEISSGDIEALETRSDPCLVAARRAGLKTYWANFGAPAERYLLFVGALIGDMGIEGRSDVQMSAVELQSVMEAVHTKLLQAKLNGTPSLHIQWQADV